MPINDYGIRSGRCFIIAEAGVNHNGNLDLALKLCDAAKNAGADCIKFQTFITERILTKSTPQALYQKKNDEDQQTQYEMVKALELGFSDFEKIKEYCEKIDIQFLSTPDDEESLKFLVNLGISVIKIGSGEVTNIPFLRHIGRMKQKVILSTGMSTLGEVEYALLQLINSGTKRGDITLLHCNSAYPTPFKDVNLMAMLTLSQAFGVKVGFSDHTLGVEIPIAAVALGATVIEKHITLDKSLDGPDHKASLDPDEFRTMVTFIRNTETALGDGLKNPSQSELINMEVVRRVIVASKLICKGEVLSDSCLTTKRSNRGIPAQRWDEVVGKVAMRSYEYDEEIEL
jgi:N,N'-diacetyllegionaminate synthase